MKYVIEHLEEEEYEWCVIEYKHISKIVGKENLIITNVKEKEKLKDYAAVYSESVSKLGLKDVCILDPEAEKTLEPTDAKKFKYVIFGGILGDYPPRKRTQEEIKLSGERRNLGREQMATDNAIFVTKKIVDGTPMEKLEFVDTIEIETDENESCVMPYRYVIVDGKPLISEELVNHLKRKDIF
jgi:ribosome biogenesis SPOUT family RNA methylase Rps3